MIIVSHRGPYTFSEDGAGGFSARRGAGGVVSALGPLLLDESGPPATWVAAAIGDADRSAMRAGATDVPGVRLRLLDLDPDEHRLHYDLVSNAVLWFWHHGMFDLAHRPRFDERFREAWSAYESVNATFADAVVEAASPGDTVLVQDYQLALVPGFVRARRSDLAVSHFSHTPHAGADAVGVLPDDVVRALLGSLAGGPAGFHTRRWAEAFTAAAGRALGAGAPGAAAFVAPLGPDADALAEVAASDAAAEAARDLDAIVGDRLVVYRSDRVEPSKNIVRGFLAFDRLLELHPRWRGRVVFVARLYRSRDALAEYLAYANEVDQVVARVNDRWSTADWSPIVLDVRDDFPASVAGLARYDVLLVNAIRDGLNLVAKEGPLVNRRDGVVCLSPEAGAWEELGPAVTRVHPFDVEQATRALHEALELPADARAARAAHLRELASARTPSDWFGDLVRATRT